MNPLEELPKEIEDIIIDYKKQFERTYTCSIKNICSLDYKNIFNKDLKEQIFYKNPYKFECRICKIKICSKHTDYHINILTTKDLCYKCDLFEIQTRIIFDKIYINDNLKNQLKNQLKKYKSKLFYLKNNNLCNINNKLKSFNNDLNIHIINDFIEIEFQFLLDN